jgi:hypothetical protein
VKTCINLLIALILSINVTFSAEYRYILNDHCIEKLYSAAHIFFTDTKIQVLKDARGIILRYNFTNSLEELISPNIKIYKLIEKFLAKIENPAIIEVHVENFPENKSTNLKKWEISTILANNIESIITKPVGTLEQSRINSIGYGEFLPAKNTPYNGGFVCIIIDIILYK